MWQEITLIIIAIFAVVCVGYKLYRFFTKPFSPCDDCCGCALKEDIKNKGYDCDKVKPRRDIC